MNTPAVPRYVIDAAAGFGGCPPGHRFNLYFPIWREADWRLDKNGKAAALRQSLKLGDAAGLLEAAIKRQRTLAEALSEDWGMPGNKDSKRRLQAAIEELAGPA